MKTVPCIQYMEKWKWSTLKIVDSYLKYFDLLRTYMTLRFITVNLRVSFLWFRDFVLFISLILIKSVHHFNFLLGNMEFKFYHGNRSFPMLNIKNYAPKSRPTVGNHKSFFSPEVRWTSLARAWQEGLGIIYLVGKSWPKTWFFIHILHF